MDDWGDDDWGDDVIEECVQLASQATAIQTSSPPARNVQNHQPDFSLNSSNVKQTSVFVFKDPNKSKIQAMCPPPNKLSSTVPSTNKLPATSTKTTTVPQLNQSSTSNISNGQTADGHQSVACKY